MNGSLILNALIFSVTLGLICGTFRRENGWSAQGFAEAFRFFTVQSNALCAAAALLMCIAPGETWVWVLKYAGTAAVTVTMLTVFFFLAPSMGGLAVLLKGSELFMHLLTPLAAIVSFVVFERRGMSFGTALWGLLPVALYGLLYLRKTVFAPEGRRWDDFYGFNRGGHWPVSFAAMIAGTFAICMGLMALQNIPR